MAGELAVETMGKGIMFSRAFGYLGGWVVGRLGGWVAVGLSVSQLIFAYDNWASSVRKCA